MMRPMTTKPLLSRTPSVPIWMGEASGGRSATSPTFFKSTSVRTRIEWQNSQVVWTALDQRNFTGAPQLGQFAAGELIFDKAAPPGGRPPARERSRSSAALQNRLPRAAGSKIHSSTTIRIPETYGRPDG